MKQEVEKRQQEEGCQDLCAMDAKTAPEYHLHSPSVLCAHIRSYGEYVMNISAACHESKRLSRAGSSVRH